ncbi:MAG: CDP-alcohol phosphatidyltransferase family protein [Eubacterium sp.]|nr:CDP-alcohol phosphatidyltransferase family protein [Eubacterium sp.]
MKKQLANIISSSRIAAAIALYFFSTVTAPFLVLYAFCGLTDAIDGPVARKTNSTSELGATLDTIGDVATYVAIAKILIAAHLVPLWVLLWFIGSAVAIIASGFVAHKRFGKFYIVHSLFGKIMGVFAFTLPFAFYFNLLVYCYCALCTSASISALESNIIQLKLKEYDPHVMALWQLKKHK